MFKHHAVATQWPVDAAEPRLRALLGLDGLGEALSVSSCCLKLLGVDGRMAAIGHAARTLLALPDPQRLLGQPWAELWPEDARAAVQTLIDVGLRGATASFDGSSPDFEGQWHHWRLATAPLMDADRRIFGLLVSSLCEPPQAEAPRRTVPRLQVHDEALLMRADRSLHAPLYTPNTGVVALVGIGDDTGARAEAALVRAGFPVLRVADWAQCAHLERQLQLATTVGLTEPHPDRPPAGRTPSRVTWRDGWDDHALVEATVRAVVRRRHERSFLELLGSIDRVRRRIRHPAIQQALDDWMALRGDAGELPDADHSVGLTIRRKAISFIASVQADGDQPSFRMDWVGSELERWLGAGLEGAHIGSPDDPVVGALHQPYERALSGLPHLDWARYQFGAIGQCTFERLILPLSCDGLSVSHLVGVVHFSRPLAH